MGIHFCSVGAHAHPESGQVPPPPVDYMHTPSESLFNKEMNDLKGANIVVFGVGDLLRICANRCHTLY